MAARILIVGISGTGKTFIARELERRTKLPIFHMDSFIWGENWQEKSESEVIQKINNVTQTDEWIIEGWIDQYSLPLLDKSQLILYLDYPGYLAAWGGVKRWFLFKGKCRPEMPAGCKETLDVTFLKLMLFRKERNHIEKILLCASPDKVMRFTSPAKTLKFLNALSQSSC